MPPVIPSHHPTLLALRLAIAIPFFYYGIQLISGLLNPGYSFVSQVASILGSDLVRYAPIFNLGIMLQGLLSIAAAGGFWRGLTLLRVHPILALPTAAAIFMSGIQSIWAGWFPMPDPRHGGHPLFVIFMLAIPPLLLLSLWRSAARPLRLYLISNLILLLVMVPFMSRMINLDAYNVQGLLQRIFTFSIFPPIAVAAWFISSRIAPRSPSPSPASQ